MEILTIIKVFTQIYPFNAQLLTFFNGEKALKNVIDELSDYFKLNRKDVEDMVNKCVNNDEGFSIRHQGRYMYFPQNLLVKKESVTHYYTYDIKDFTIEEKTNLRDIRLFSPLYISFLMTMQCYTDCIYCYANRKMKIENSLTLEQIYSIIEQAKELHMLSFDINGGEVLMHPHYKEIISCRIFTL